MSRRDDQSILSQPRANRLRGGSRRPDAFGAFSEAFARFMGTPSFIGWMTLIIGVWLSWNVWAPEAWRFDPYPFQFLTLGLSLQASYAAPLILLAQNRQEQRDKISLENDRALLAQSRSDVDFLAREMADINFKMRNIATREFISRQFNSLEHLLANTASETDPRIPTSREDSSTG